MINDLIILGGSYSVTEGIDKGLFTFLQDKFTIGINYSYKFVNTTCNLGIDECLYEGTGTVPPETHNEVARLPLWIGKAHKHIKRPEPNSIFLKPSKVYDRDLKGGVYRASLSGIFALSLAIKLLDYAEGDTSIHLLGYGYGLQKNYSYTHWYEKDFKHRGTGKTSWYQQTGIDPETKQRIKYAELEYKPFKTETKVKIFNVGESNIPTFDKINYEDLFSKKLSLVRNQDELRQEIREVLCQIKQTQNI
jgi:hypothetical protein